MLDAIEQTYGVERGIVLALWGIESSFGSGQDRWDVIRSLATLAEARYRDPYFRNELLVALQILQEGHIARERMLGSWAGAMGQPQFMPSSFYEYAVDFTGDGRRDIWTSVPDVLASIANYLARTGWQRDLPWGFEVVLPQRLRLPDEPRRVRRMDQARRAARRRRRLAGRRRRRPAVSQRRRGPAFLVTANFNVIKLYNNSDVYALAVGHLADRMRGGAPFRAAWPKDDPQLSRDARIALQRKLASLGYAVKDFAGRLDFDQRDAIRELEASTAWCPTAIRHRRCWRGSELTCDSRSLAETIFACCGRHDRVQPGRAPPCASAHSPSFRCCSSRHPPSRPPRTPPATARSRSPPWWARSRRRRRSRMRKALANMLDGRLNFSVPGEPEDRRQGRQGRVPRQQCRHLGAFLRAHVRQPRRASSTGTPHTSSMRP